MVASFGLCAEAPFILAYDDTTDANNVVLFRYLEKRIRFGEIPLAMRLASERNGPAIVRAAPLRQRRVHVPLRRHAA